MFKLFVIACVLATAYALPAPGVIAVHPAVVPAPVAVSHTSSHVVHTPVVKTIVAPAPLVAHHVPVVAAHPVVAHHAVAHHAIVAPAVVKTVVPGPLVVAHH